MKRLALFVRNWHLRNCIRTLGLPPPTLTTKNIATNAKKTGDSFLFAQKTHKNKIKR